MITLRGMTWKHDRGLAPMLATAARWSETHPDIRIDWEARSLQGFADHPIRNLAEEFDLLVLDHPFMGTVAKGGYLVPLDTHISPEVLSTLRSESVGASHESYFYQGHQWALAIDAAAQVAGYRPDLLAAAGMKVPSTLDEVSDLARVRKGFVTTPLLPVDSFCSFLTLCTSFGETPFAAGSHQIVGKRAGESALQQLKALGEFAINDAHEMNPIAVWEKMSTTDEIAYCPIAFGYSNYARPGYRRAPIHFTNIPSRPPRGTGGLCAWRRRSSHFCRVAKSFRLPLITRCGWPARNVRRRYTFIPVDSRATGRPGSIPQSMRSRTISSKLLFPRSNRRSCGRGLRASWNSKRNASFLISNFLLRKIQFGGHIGLAG